MYNFPGFKIEWEKANQEIGRRGSVSFGRADIEEYELLEESGSNRILDATLCGK